MPPPILESKNLPFRCAFAVADPRFPPGEGANPPEGRQHTILPNFPKNCMKLKEFEPLGAWPSRPPPLDPPLICTINCNACTFCTFGLILFDEF